MVGSCGYGTKNKGDDGRDKKIWGNPFHLLIISCNRFQRE